MSDQSDKGRKENDVSNAQSDENKTQSCMEKDYKCEKCDKVMLTQTSLYEQKVMLQNIKEIQNL